MVEDEEEIKNLLELRKMLTSRIEKLNRTVERLSKYVEILDKILAEKSLRTADKIGIRLEKVSDVVHKGKLVGQILIDRERKVLIVRPGELKVDSSKRPISSFLVRELEKIKEIDPNCNYKILSDESGTLEEIIVENIPPSELNDLVRKIKWALQKSLV